jgi:hypothetical protein
MDRGDVLAEWASDVRRRLGAVKASALSLSIERTLKAVQGIEQYAGHAATAGNDSQQAGARAFAFAIARAESATLLIEHGSAQGERAGITSAQRWCTREMASLIEADAEHRAGSAALAR